MPLPLHQRSVRSRPLPWALAGLHRFATAPLHHCAGPQNSGLRQLRQLRLAPENLVHSVQPAAPHFSLRMQTRPLRHPSQASLATEMLPVASSWVKTVLQGLLQDLMQMSPAFCRAAKMFSRTG